MKQFNIFVKQYNSPNCDLFVSFLWILSFLFKILHGLELGVFDCYTHY